MLVREGNKIVIRSKVNEFLGFSKKDKLNKAVRMEKDVFGLSHASSLSRSGTGVSQFFDLKDTEKAWKLFNKYGDYTFDLIGSPVVNYKKRISDSRFSSILKEIEEDPNSLNYRKLSDLSDYRGAYISFTDDKGSIDFIIDGEVAASVRTDADGLKKWCKDNGISVKEAFARRDEFLGFSKSEKVDKIQGLYEKLISGSDLDLVSKFSSKNKDVYNDYNPSKTWKLFVQLGETLEKTVGSRVGNLSVDSAEDNFKEYKELDKEGDIPSMKNVRNIRDYKGPYVIDSDSGKNRRIQYYCNGKCIGEIFVDYANAKEWSEKTLGKKVSELVDALKAKFNKVDPIFAPAM